VNGIVTLNTIRQRTGDRLAENWRTIPHVFQAIEADFTGIEAARVDIKARFKAEQGISLTYLPFIARAVCLALDAFPQVNARFDGKALSLSRDVNLGIAVDLNHNGLVVPVVKNAGDLTTLGLAKAIARMVEKARSGKLSVDELSGGTYSISNNGAFGTLFTAPIINAPQVAILSVDAIRKRPAIVETPEGDFVTARLIGMIGQSFDHRAFDGAYSAAYLSKLKSIIETRNWAEDLASGRAS
jgi:pyruvate/2-oxoglutarate dehydrogenase complex dihydrolipoamide acyltransferase (E2) component